MLLLFRSGWLHVLFGTVFLAGTIAVIGFLDGNPFSFFAPLRNSAWLKPELALWVVEGMLGHLGILAAATLVGVTIFPERFLRWWLTSLSRIYANMSPLRAVSLGLMAALLIEPLLRLGLQPRIIQEFEPISASFALAAIVAGASWTPFANTLTLVTFFESLWFSYLFIASKNPYVPVLAHGLSEFAIAMIVWRIQRMGFTSEPSPKAEPLV